MRGDYYKVNKQHRLVGLPATPTVSQMLDDFVRQKMSDNISADGRRYCVKSGNKCFRGIALFQPHSWSRGRPAPLLRLAAALPTAVLVREALLRHARGQVRPRAVAGLRLRAPAAAAAALAPPAAFDGQHGAPAGPQ